MSGGARIRPPPTRGARSTSPATTARRSRSPGWSIWHGPGDESLRTCTIITRPANERIAVLHDRMPVILDPRDEADWLDAATPEGALREMLAGLPAERTALTEVGRAVNDARHDAPDCLEPPAAPAPERLEPQPSLF